MKRELYSLANKELAYLVNLLGSKLRSRGIPHSVVGGVSVQAYNAEQLCREQKRNLAAIKADESFRLQDSLRATDDIDLALGGLIGADGKRLEVSPREVSDILKSLEGEFDAGDALLFYRLGENGSYKNPDIQMSTHNGRGEDMRMNIFRNPFELDNMAPEKYDEFIKRGRELVVPYDDNLEVKVRVYDIADLLAAKVSHFRAKDASDMLSLWKYVRAYEDKQRVLRRMKGLLVPDYKKDPTIPQAYDHSERFSRFQGLVGERDSD